MTRHDIENLSAVGHSLKSLLDETNFDQYIDRMLWAIRASTHNPRFDEQRFRLACKGEGLGHIFDAEKTT